MITIVVASYRYGHLAAGCIESLLSQTKLPDKILFVDDGVGDCQHLKKIYPEVEYTFREENIGVQKNFHDMLMKVETEYVMFLGADNWLRSDSIEKLTGHPEDVINYDIQVTGELRNNFPIDKSNIINGDIWWKRNGNYHGSMVYRTSLGKQVGYITDGRPHEDHFMWEGLLKLNVSVKYIPEPFLQYRRHRENWNPV